MKIERNELTHEYVRECFDYFQETGKVIWKVRPREHFSSDAVWKIVNTRQAGKEAGSVNNQNGYHYIWINYTHYKMHRIIWLWMTGEWPKEQIDHKNGVRDDNRWENLRDVSNTENQRNVRMRKNNSTGVMGVSHYPNNHKLINKYQARIGVDGRVENLGYFATLDEAAHARKQAEIKYGFHKDHGTERKYFDKR